MIRPGPVGGLALQVFALLVLAAGPGLGPAGWVVGLGYGVAVWAALTRGLNHGGSGGLGPADWVTLVRAVLVGAIAALVADHLGGWDQHTLLVVIAAIALALDAVDGAVARHTGTASRLGARFDMEVDSFLLLVLSLYVARTVGAWVLAIGGMRYAFVAAGWLLPWLRAQLPPRYWRKVVAATQGVVLVTIAAGILPSALAVAAGAIALLLLIEAFGRDVLWLWRHRRDVASPGRQGAGRLPTSR